MDFVFTTVPIYRKVSVPIMEIHDFLESGEIMSIRHRDARACWMGEAEN